MMTNSSSATTRRGNKMRAASLALVLLALAPFAAQACIFKYGTALDSLAAPSGGTPWNHGFKGDDWNGTDASGNQWQCLSGTKQSPIAIGSYGVLDVLGNTIPADLQTKMHYNDLVSDGSNVEVINTGHTIQVEWLYNYVSNVQIAVPAYPTSTTPITSVLSMNSLQATKFIKATPLQFHFHANSEHIVEGKYYPLELHIVHRITDLPACANGCFAVIGIVFELTTGGDNPLLSALWNVLPTREGSINKLPAGARIALGDLLPPSSERDYVTYEGSLTTPPCSEGLLWHVLSAPQKISRAQLAKYMSAVGFKDCALKPNTTAAPAGHRHRRSLQAAELPPGTTADDFECKVAAYGYNYRSIQSTNARPVKLARAPTGLLGGLLG